MASEERRLGRPAAAKRVGSGFPQPYEAHTAKAVLALLDALEDVSEELVRARGASADAASPVEAERKRFFELGVYAAVTAFDGCLRNPDESLLHGLTENGMTRMRLRAIADAIAGYEEDRDYELSQARADAEASAGRHPLHSLK